MQKKCFLNTFLLIIFLLNVSLINAEDEVVRDRFITDLTPTNFYREMHFKSYFVMFYIPWCKNSKQIAFLWEQIGEYYYNKNNFLYAHIGKVDCAKYHTLCLSNGISQYPKLLFFRVKRTYDVIPYRKDHDLIEYNLFISDLVGNRRQTEDEIVDDLIEYIRSTEPLINHVYYADNFEHNRVNNDDHADNVYELNTKTFDGHIEYGTVFVNFYTPACEYCEKVEPIWIKLALKFQFRYSDNVKIAKINCLKNQQLCAEETNNAFPTMVIYYNGLRAGEFEGNKFNLEELYDYVKTFIPNDEL